VCRIEVWVRDRGIARAGDGLDVRRGLKLANEVELPVENVQRNADLVHI